MRVSAPSCEWCGADMAPKSYRGNPKRFCSELCRTRAYRANNPEYAAKRREAARMRRLAKRGEREASLPPKRWCLNCQGVLAVRSERATYCNARDCQAAQKAASRKVAAPCSVAGCGRGVLARGYCPSHYKSEYHVPKFGASPVRMKTRTCVCGAEVTSRAGKQKYCSDVCRYQWRDVERSDSSAVVVWERPLRIPVVRSPRVTAIPRKQSRRFACTCVVCGLRFVADGMHRTCSDACRRERQSPAVERARRKYAKLRGEFAVSRSFRLSIYERDGWSCQLCGTPTSRRYSPTDPLSPTLDHIVPRSLQSVPDDSASNLRLACALCNSTRSNNIDWVPDKVPAV